MKFGSEEKVNSHMIKTHNHPCDKCDKIFTKKSLLKDHRKIDHGLTRYACPYDKSCQTTFAERKNFKRHEGYHSGKYQCPIEGCGKTPKTELGFREHQRSHGHERRFACEVGGCGRTFQARRGLVRHGIVHGKGFQCGIRPCRRIFLSQTRLDQHLKGHQNAETEAEEGAIDHLASGFISNFFDGVESLISMPKGLVHPPVQQCTRDYWVEQLVKKADEINERARSSWWCCLFLAGTIWSSRHWLPAQTILEVGSRAKRTASRRVGAAEVVNAVVKSLYPNWNFKAYLVYHALAGRSPPLGSEYPFDLIFEPAKQYALCEIGKLSSGKRSKVVGKIVAGLRDRQPGNVVVEWPPFDPARHISQMLQLEYGLSLLIYHVKC